MDLWHRRMWWVLIFLLFAGLNLHSSKAKRLKVVLVTLEYTKETFSGNGVYSHSIVQSLVDSGCKLLVVCGVPKNKYPKGEHLHADGVDILTIPLGTWFRLDQSASWEEFALGIQNWEEAIRHFGPDVVLGVDWTGMAAVSNLSLRPSIPIYFLSFRVYFASKGLADDPKSVAFYKKMERHAVALAKVSIFLTKKDFSLMSSAYPPSMAHKILLPPLRRQMQTIASKTSPGNRSYLVCCVRLSKEKNPMLFADLVTILGPFLRSVGVVPLLCGAAADPEYAAAVKNKFSAAASNGVIIEDFLSPERLADVYRNAILNFHPCHYDAYGMTVVEAAAFGVPSIVHGPGLVGATELLSSPKFSIELDLTASVEEIADYVREILINRVTIRKVGDAAKAKSLSWTEEANAKELLEVIKA